MSALFDGVLEVRGRQIFAVKEGEPQEWICTINLGHGSIRDAKQKAHKRAVYIAACVNPVLTNAEIIQAHEEPIDMILFCPRCGLQHIDEPDESVGWTNPPHRSHKCHECKWVWRQADVPTNGVKEILTKGKEDNTQIRERALSPRWIALP